MQTELATLATRTDLLDFVSIEDRKTLELFCLYLSEHGIEHAAYDEGDLQMFVFMSKPGANMKVQVSEEDYAEAVTCLIEFEQKHPDLVGHIFSCPECGSFAVEYPQFSRKFITPLFLEWLSNLGLFKKQCYCRKCHATWPKTRLTSINPLHLKWNPDISVPPPA
ncbi:MAG: hypothetical protein JWR15_3783 [Prosthecobacter sp.]|nr:hypothetical protein [Prosthecobacter sp.]